MNGWSGFHEEAKSETYTRGPECSVRAFLASLTPKDAKQVASVIDDRKLQGSAIARALRNRVGDEAPTAHSINRHRNDRCSCSRRQG